MNLDDIVKFKWRILSNINLVEGGCWESKLKPRDNGYVRSSFGMKVWYLHRLSYHLFIGVIPDNYDVCHSCDNRRCVNPDHLFVGTRKDNMMDAKRKNRQAKGEMLPQSKLTDKQRKEVIEKIKDGDLYKDIGSEYGVTRHAIGHIGIINNLRRNKKNVSK